MILANSTALHYHLPIVQTTMGDVRVSRANASRLLPHSRGEEGRDQVLDVCLLLRSTHLQSYSFGMECLEKVYFIELRVRTVGSNRIEITEP